MEISKIINKVRFRLNDTNESKFSEYDVLEAINESYKQYREICMQEAPEFLAERRNGVLNAGENAIPVGDVSEVIELRTSDRVLKAKRKLPIWEDSGEPREYALGRNADGLCLYVYPTTNTEFEYELILVPQMTRLSGADDIDVPNDVADCIVEFSVNALGGNPETYMAIDFKLRNILRRYVPVNDFIESYY